MQLYFDPISTTSRPVMLFIAEHGLDVEFVHVDLMSGGHLAPEYLALNPNGVVPFLVDGDLSLGESTAILKYLAAKTGSATYPTNLAAQAKIDEAVAWFSTNFHEYFCLFTCYPNMGVPHGLDPVIAQGLMAYGEEHSARWLKVLDQHMLGATPYVCGEQPTIADYLGISFVLLGEIAAFDFSPYPNIEAWVARMRKLPSFERTFAGYYGLLTALRGQVGQPA